MKRLIFLPNLLAAQSSCRGTITDGANNTCNGSSNCSEVLVLNMNLDTILSVHGGDSTLLCNTPGNSGVNCASNALEFSNFYLYDPANLDGNSNNNNNNGGNGGGEYIGVLFVALTDFDAEINTTNNTVELNWVTAAEKDNDYFTLKKSTDGVNWITVANIAGAENSDEELSYSYTDTELNSETVYYQLSQTDFDGSYHEFGIITVKNQTQQNLIARTNLLGQPVDEFYKGMVIKTYADGTTEKVFQQ